MTMRTETDRMFLRVQDFGAGHAGDFGSELPIYPNRQRGLWGATPILQSASAPHRDQTLAPQTYPIPTHLGS